MVIVENAEKAGSKHKFNRTSSNIPKSQHVAGDLCVVVVKIVITHSSPCVVVVDLKTSRIGRSVVTSKSHLH